MQIQSRARSSFHRAALVGCCAAAVALALLAPSLADAQLIRDLPQPSPASEVSQTVGITDIAVEYHRPGAKEREIFGALVPYGQVWRAGANENTLISFSDPVTVEGEELPAGSYGLHMIPGEGEWTVIFSNVTSGWGSFNYDEANDALRVTVEPQEADHEEWLSYAFEELASDSTVLAMRWEKVKVPLRIAVDTHQLALAHIEEELNGFNGFFWQGFMSAANYTLQNKVHLDKGLEWIDRSITMNENFQNVAIKSALLASDEQLDAAREAALKAVEIGAEPQARALAGFLTGNGQPNLALAVLEANASQNPDSWQAHSGLADGYSQAGDTGKAAASYNRALELTEDEEQRQAISDKLGALES